MLNLFRTFLAHAKSNRLEPADLRSRVATARNGTPDLRESLFLDLFDDVREEWDSRLREASEVDFEDMLNQATDLVEAGRVAVPLPGRARRRVPGRQPRARKAGEGAGQPPGPLPLRRWRRLAVDLPVRGVRHLGDDAI